MSKSYLKEFREKNIGELEECLRVAKTIRDSKTATARDKNEAIKIIARLLSALQPDRTVTESKKVTGKVEVLSPELLERINNEYSPTTPRGPDPSTEDPLPKGNL